MTIKTIHQLCYNIDLGSTEPKFAFLSDGSQAVVKLMNGPQGNLVLFNEYLCYRLAILLDIPMPTSGICIMDTDTEIQNNIADSTNYGKAFFSAYMPKTTKLVPRIINTIKNKDDFIKILLFDHIIFNTDRNPGNLLVEYYKNNISLKVIDHSHVFINQAIWDSNCLERAMSSNDLLSTRVLEDNSYLYNMFFRNMSISKEILTKSSFLFQKQLTCDIITDIITAIPKEWLPPTNNDITSLTNYIMYRVDNIDVIISMIMKYIKS